MSNEDPYRPDRGAYTPDDDDRGYRRPFDQRGGGGWNGPPVTLLISVGVLVLLIVAVAVFYRSGLRSSEDAPPAVGAPVGTLTVEAPKEAQPIDPAEGVDVYDRTAAVIDETPTYVPPPEAARPRPAPPVVVETRPATPAPAPKAAAPAVAAGGSSSVQIGAFSTPGIADQQYAALTARHPQLTRGGAKRVQEVTTSAGATVYRTTITGLSREQAVSLCDAIKSGGGDCFVR